jgi:hypothetical protein
MRNFGCRLKKSRVAAVAGKPGPIETDYEFDGMA